MRTAFAGEGDGGAAVIQNALAAWNNDCASSTNLVYGTTTTPPANFDGVNVVAFGDPGGTIAGSWTGSGTIAVTSTSATTATHDLGGTLFFGITSADIVYQDGYTAAEPSFQTSMAHEVGHAIGWRHSNATPSSGNDQTVTCNSGTEECTPTNTAIMFWQAGAFGATLQTFDINAVRGVYPGTPCTATEGDTNSDTTADVVWHRDAGENYLWLMAPSTGDVLNALALPFVSPSTWNIVANGDFNGDGKGDLIWRRSSDGVNYLWTLNGGTVLNAEIMQSATLNWSVVGAGDFNGDGKDDLFWRDNTGLDYVWLMNGATLINAIGLPSVPTTWNVVGVGDANNDGTDDVFWREQSTGANYLWTMSNGLLSVATGLQSVDSTWTPVAVADFSGDGKADVFWRRNDGVNYMWLMNGPTVTIAALMPTVSDLGWSVVAAGDFNGDTKADLFWRHTSGINYEWQLNGTSLTLAKALTDVSDTTWRVKAPK
ncbi:MAG TPA: FG-GAP-like repeat-containing protein [Thermoanaerobaculia bacterium]|nr:FG-GAP-like repeat-containing protein [Thermoanaerobaculia bacterium]